MNRAEKPAIDSTTARRLLVLVLVAAALLRLIHLTSPIADDQSWNQASAATVARHFANDGIDFFHTRWDVLHRMSAGPRIEIEEAPIYHTIVAILTKIGGSIPIWGRIVSIAFGTLAGLFLFLLVERRTDQRTALFATVFFVFSPYVFFFCRTFMSDPAMIFSIIAALYYFDRYCESEKAADALVSALLVSLAGLFKPFALHIGVPILIFAFQRFGFGLFRRPVLYLFALISLGPTLAWVAWAAKIGTLGGVTDNKAVTEAPHLWGRLSLLWDPAWYYRLQWRLFDRMSTPIVSVLMAATVIIKPARKKAGFFFVWLIGVAVYIGLVRSGNEGHNYYQLPAAAPFAAIAAIGLCALLDKLSAGKQKPVAIGVFAAFFVVSFLYVLPHYKLDISSHKAGLLAKNVTEAHEKILVVDPGATRKNQVIFASEREGWHYQNLKPELIAEYKELGARAVVLVLEKSQMKKSAPTLKFLDENFVLAETAAGDFGRGKNAYHEIRVYRLDDK